MRKIGVVTTSRADYGSVRSIVQRIQADSDLELALLVSGSHLSSSKTISAIEADGFPIAEKIEMQLASDTPKATGLSLGIGMMGFVESLSRIRPDLLVVVGDRYELLAVASAALILHIPLVHVSGGEITEGAIDDSVRHALTKLSHLHFVSMEEAARRVQQMGEAEWRVHITGDPALDALHEMTFLTPTELAASLGVDKITPPFVSFTFHPTTLSSVSVEAQIDAVLAALDNFSGTLIMTMPNADTGQQVIREKITRFCQQHPAAYVFESLGQQRFYSLLHHADLMVGNSSSGIWESASFALPVVNIGERQAGRLRADNVIDVDYRVENIRAAIQKALSPEFRLSLQGLKNPYGDGHAAEKIVTVLKTIPLDHQLLTKKFVDMKDKTL